MLGVKYKDTLSIFIIHRLFLLVLFQSFFKGGFLCADFNLIDSQKLRRKSPACLIYNTQNIPAVCGIALVRKK